MEKIREVNKIFLITVAAAVTASFFVGAVPFIQENELWNLLISQLVYATPTFAYLIQQKEPLTKTLRIHKIRPATVLLLIVFAYLITPVLNLLNAVSMLFSKNIISNSLGGIITEYPLWIGIGAIALIPCILEECVYRGVFFNEYRKVNPRLGILLSGLLFGMMHMNLNQFFYAFVMGTIFALLVEATDSLLSSMVVHFVINATSVVLSLRAENLVTVADKGELISMIRLILIPAIITMALAFWVLQLIAATEGRREAMKALFAKTDKKRETVITPPLLLGIVICAILMLYIELVNRFIP